MANRIFTSLVPAIVEQSRSLPDNTFLRVDDNHWPAVFTCDYRQQQATGFVARNGLVVLVPDDLSTGAFPLVCRHFREVDRLVATGEIANILYEWQVTRRPLQEVSIVDGNDEP